MKTKNELIQNIKLLEQALDVANENTELANNRAHGLETLNQILNARLSYWKQFAIENKETSINLAVTMDLKLV